MIKYDKIWCKNSNPRVKEFDFFGTHFSGSNPDWEATILDWKFSMNSSFLILCDTNLKYMCYNEAIGVNNMSKVNKYESLVKSYYNNYTEDERLRTRKSHRIEYITTMHYIKKFAKKGCKILEVGAGTGVYSVELAKMGYDVTAVDLVESNVEVLKKNAEGVKNIKCLQGDALDLSRFKDNEFDIVLNLGPMYHLYTTRDKNKAIAETLRVCKNSGICMFAYLTHSSTFWSIGIVKKKIKYLSEFMTNTGVIKDVPEEIFCSYFNEDFNKQFAKTKSVHITSVATDGLAQIMREYMDREDFTEEEYDLFIKWHLATCERLDHQGLSSHMLYICKKD